MKLWQKIYLAVMVVGVLFCNIGIYAVFQLTYQKEIETELRRGQVDYGLISDSVQETMETLEKQGRLTEEAAADLMMIYEEEHSNQDMHFRLWKNGRQLYPGDKEEIPAGVLDGHANITVWGGRQQKELRAMGILDSLSDSYILSMVYPLKELNDTWGRLYQIYILISFGISIVLAVVLSIFLSFFLRPLRRMREQVSEIRNGNYASRVKVEGKDELAVLGENINAMAETISAHIDRLHEDNRKKEQLVDNLAHEMKSPLTSIYGFAEYLLKGKTVPGEEQECYAYIMEESRRMKDMCYALMDLSKMRHQDITFCDFPAADFLDKIKELVDRRWCVGGEMENVEFVWKMEGVAGGFLYGNPQLLEMLICNFLQNAIRACQKKEDKEKNKKRVMVCLEDGGSEFRFCLRVRDEGLGMTVEEIARITEPFYRVDRGRSREDGGNGLGLSLCQQIVELHNGIMSFQSTVGVGTEAAAFLWKN